MTLVEGAREVARALATGHLPTEAWVCPELLQTPEAHASLAHLRQLDAQRRCRLYTVAPELFAKDV